MAVLEKLNFVLSYLFQLNTTKNNLLHRIKLIVY